MSEKDNDDETPDKIDETPYEIDETPYEIDETPNEIDETPNEIDDEVIVVKISSITDERLKEISEVFGNSTSRKIILLLVKQEMYLNEIAIKLDLRVSLIVYHLKKFGSLGILSITKKPISKRTKQHKYFSIRIDAFMITLREPDATPDEKSSKFFHNNKFFKKIFKNSVKLTATIFASFIAFQNIPTLIELRWKTPNLSPGIELVVIITGIVVIGLIIYRYFKNKKN